MVAIPASKPASFKKARFKALALESNSIESKSLQNLAHRFCSTQTLKA
ncbi:hypothetical protein [uncultured Helicobacter sp.]